MQPSVGGIPFLNFYRSSYDSAAGMARAKPIDAVMAGQNYVSDGVSKNGLSPTT